MLFNRFQFEVVLNIPFIIAFFCVVEYFTVYRLLSTCISEWLHIIYWASLKWKHGQLP